MFVEVALLLLLGAPVPDPAVVIVPTATGVETRIGGYHITGSQIFWNPKTKQVVVQGSDQRPASVKHTQAGRASQTQAKKITLDLKTGKMRAVEEP